MTRLRCLQVSCDAPFALAVLAAALIEVAAVR